MTENLDGTESVLDGGANPPVEEGKPADSISANPLQKTVESLEHRFGSMEAVLKGLQKDRDRASNRALEEVGDLRKAFGEVQTLMKRGMSEEEAFDALEGRKADQEFRSAVFELRDAFKGGTRPAAVAGSTEETARVFAEYGLSESDPAVTRLFALKGVELRAAAADLAFRQASTKPPSPSEARSVVGGAATPRDTQSKIEELSKLQKSPSKNREAIKKLTAELDSAGWGG